MTIHADGHVHIHPAFDGAALLAAAIRNMGGAARGAVHLLLTEMTGVDAFAAWRDGAVPVGWTAHAHPGDAAALSLSGPDGVRVVLIAGRQVVTVEGVEVLAHATRAAPPDGAPLRATLDAVVAAGATPVLPWGVGKWIGRRGRLVAAAVEAGRRGAGPAVLLGDNASRARGVPAPAVFARAPVLPGTDPLPLPGAERGVGRYGFVLDGEGDEERPAADLARRIATLAATPPPLGRRDGVVRVMRDQVALRRTRGRRASGAGP